MGMARMYCNGHGKSKSTLPYTLVPPTHVKTTEAQLTGLIVDLAKKGTTGAQIGNILRDEYAIGQSSSITNRKILKVLKDNEAAPAIPDDIRCVEKKCQAIYNHIRKNWNDKDARFRLKHKEGLLH